MDILIFVFLCIYLFSCDCLKNVVFNTCFQEFDHNMPLCDILYICLAWVSLNFLYLFVDRINQIWKIY